MLLKLSPTRAGYHQNQWFLKILSDIKSIYTVWASAHAIQTLHCCWSLSGIVPNTCIRVSCCRLQCGTVSMNWDPAHPAGPSHGPRQTAWVSDVQCSHVHIQILGLPRIRAAPPPPQRSRGETSIQKQFKQWSGPTSPAQPNQPSPAQTRRDVWCGWVTVDNMDGGRVKMTSQYKVT